jgi:hypothetical protein
MGHFRVQYPGYGLGQQIRTQGVNVCPLAERRARARGRGRNMGSASAARLHDQAASGGFAACVAIAFWLRAGEATRQIGGGNRSSAAAVPAKPKRKARTKPCREPSR